MIVLLLNGIIGMLVTKYGRILDIECRVGMQDVGVVFSGFEWHMGMFICMKSWRRTTITCFRWNKCMKSAKPRIYRNASCFLDESCRVALKRCDWLIFNRPEAKRVDSILLNELVVCPG